MDTTHALAGSVRRLAGGAYVIIDAKGKARIMDDEDLQAFDEPDTCGICDGIHGSTCPAEENLNGAWD